MAESLAGRRGQGSPGLSGAFAWLRPHGPQRLGIDIEAFRKFIADEKPTYPQCEAWVLAQCGGSLDPETVANLNASIAGYHHKDEVRKTILDANGIPDDGTILDAINLNNLDDWLGFHKEVIVG